MARTKPLKRKNKTKAVDTVKRRRIEGSEGSDYEDYEDYRDYEEPSEKFLKYNKLAPELRTHILSYSSNPTLRQYSACSAYCNAEVHHFNKVAPIELRLVQCLHRLSVKLIYEKGTVHKWFRIGTVYANAFKKPYDYLKHCYKYVKYGQTKTVTIDVQLWPRKIVNIRQILGATRWNVTLYKPMYKKFYQFTRRRSNQGNVLQLNNCLEHYYYVKVQANFFKSTFVRGLSNLIINTKKVVDWEDEEQWDGDESDQEEDLRNIPDVSVDKLPKKNSNRDENSAMEDAEDIEDEENNNMDEEEESESEDERVWDADESELDEEEWYEDEIGEIDEEYYNEESEQVEEYIDLNVVEQVVGEYYVDEMEQDSEEYHADEVEQIIEEWYDDEMEQDLEDYDAGEVVEVEGDWAARELVQIGEEWYIEEIEESEEELDIVGVDQVQEEYDADEIEQDETIEYQMIEYQYDAQINNNEDENLCQMDYGEEFIHDEDELREEGKNGDDNTQNDDEESDIEVV